MAPNKYQEKILNKLRLFFSKLNIINYFYPKDKNPENFDINKTKKSQESLQKRQDPSQETLQEEQEQPIYAQVQKNNTTTQEKDPKKELINNIVKATNNVLLNADVNTQEFENLNNEWSGIDMHGGSMLSSLAAKYKNSNSPDPQIDKYMREDFSEANDKQIKDYVDNLKNITFTSQSHKTTHDALVTEIEKNLKEFDSKKIDSGPKNPASSIHQQNDTPALPIRSILSSGQDDLVDSITKNITKLTINILTSKDENANAASEQLEDLWSSSEISTIKARTQLTDTNDADREAKTKKFAESLEKKLSKSSIQNIEEYIATLKAIKYSNAKEQQANEELIIKIEENVKEFKDKQATINDANSPKPKNRPPVKEKKALNDKKLNLAEKITQLTINILTSKDENANAASEQLEDLWSSKINSSGHGEIYMNKTRAQLNDNNDQDRTRTNENLKQRIKEKFLVSPIKDLADYINGVKSIKYADAKEQRANEALIDEIEKNIKELNSPQVSSVAQESQTKHSSNQQKIPLDQQQSHNKPSYNNPGKPRVSTKPKLTKIAQAQKNKSIDSTEPEEPEYVNVNAAFKDEVIYTDVFPLENATTQKPNNLSPTKSRTPIKSTAQSEYATIDFKKTNQLQNTRKNNHEKPIDDQVPKNDTTDQEKDPKKKLINNIVKATNNVLLNADVNTQEFENLDNEWSGIDMQGGLMFGNLAAKYKNSNSPDPQIDQYMTEDFSAANDKQIKDYVDNLRNITFTNQSHKTTHDALVTEIEKNLKEQAEKSNVAVTSNNESSYLKGKNQERISGLIKDFESIVKSNAKNPKVVNYLKDNFTSFNALNTVNKNNDKSSKNFPSQTQGLNATIGNLLKNQIAELKSATEKLDNDNTIHSNTDLIKLEKDIQQLEENLDALLKSEDKLVAENMHDEKAADMTQLSTEKPDLGYHTRRINKQNTITSQERNSLI